MLTDLHVKNLALIDETEVTFGPGLNILTGETGAGKSILIGSINLALGHKMQRDMIRQGSDSCLVELVFQVENPTVLAKLTEMEVETEDGQLIITRKITGSRSICRINGETCTAARIREISSLLLDIHGQHEHQKLLYPDNQLEILDAYSREQTGSLLARVTEDYKAWREIRNQLKAFAIDDKERERELSFLRYEIDEIENADLKAGEEEELEKIYRRMSHSRKIAEALGCVQRLTDSDGGAGDGIGRAVQELASIVEFDESLKGMADTIADIDNLLNDFNREVSDYLDEFTFSEEEFYQTEKRLDQINDLKAKFGRTIEDVMNYLAAQKEKLTMMEHFEEEKSALEAKLAKAQKQLEKSSQALSDARQKAAAVLSEEIRKGLVELNFLSVAFDIVFSRNEHYAANGFDSVEFMISTNPGEPVRPLAKVVSGGELSRIMLAIKTLLADKDATETLIFDEIDTGISGRTAQKVSEKMARIGHTHQVLCITHLAQIAAMADHHYVIAKDVADGSTTSHIQELDKHESVEELARILGGAEITQAVLDNAGEMKDLAEERKKKM